jgi:hypothetical protein
LAQWERSYNFTTYKQALMHMQMQMRSALAGQS